MTQESNGELIEQMRVELDRVMDRIAANCEALEQLGEAAAEVTSRDGMVTVRVAEGGFVERVHLDPRAMASDAETVSATITRTVREAVSAAVGDSLDIAPSNGASERDEDSGVESRPDSFDDGGPVFTGLGPG